MMHFFLQHFSTFPHKNHFFPRSSSLFQHLSNYCSDKNPNPSTLGGAYPKCSTHFKTYPKLWNIMWGKREGSGENAPFVRKKWKNDGEEKKIHSPPAWLLGVSAKKTFHAVCSWILPQHKQNIIIQNSHNSRIEGYPLLDQGYPWLTQL